MRKKKYLSPRDRSQIEGLKKALPPGRSFRSLLDLWE